MNTKNFFEDPNGWGARFGFLPTNYFYKSKEDEIEEQNNTTTTTTTTNISSKNRQYFSRMETTYNTKIPEYVFPSADFVSQIPRITKLELLVPKKRFLADMNKKKEEVSRKRKKIEVLFTNFSTGTIGQSFYKPDYNGSSSSQLNGEKDKKLLNLSNKCKYYQIFDEEGVIGFILQKDADCISKSSFLYEHPKHFHKKCPYLVETVPFEIQKTYLSDVLFKLSEEEAGRDSQMRSLQEKLDRRFQYAKTDYQLELEFKEFEQKLSQAREEHKQRVKELLEKEKSHTNNSQSQFFNTSSSNNDNHNFFNPRPERTWFKRDISSDEYIESFGKRSFSSAFEEANAERIFSEFFQNAFTSSSFFKQNKNPFTPSSNTSSTDSSNSNTNNKRQRNSYSQQQQQQQSHQQRTFAQPLSSDQNEAKRFLETLGIVDKKSCLKWMLAGGHSDKKGDPKLHASVMDAGRKLGFFS